MQCTACGKSNPTQAKFCEKCGASLSAEAASSREPKSTKESPALKGSPKLPTAEPQAATVDRNAIETGKTQASWLNMAPSESSLPFSAFSLVVPRALEKYRGENVAGTFLFSQREPLSRVQVFGKESLKLGRVPGQNDVTLFVLPLTQENATLTRAISTQHFHIQLDTNGLWLHDHSTYGTSLNGQKVQGSAAIPLDKVSEVAVAMSLKLRLTPLVKQPPVAEREQDPYRSIAPADELWTRAAQLGLGGILVERMTNLAEAECYLMVFTWAALGPKFDGDAELPLVEGGRLRLVRRAGQFWIHNLAAVTIPTVDGVDLPVGSISPLLPGVRLTLGSETAEWTELQQCGIEDAY